MVRRVKSCQFRQVPQACIIIDCVALGSGISIAEIAQLVEHATENRGVLGPIPSLGTEIVFLDLTFYYRYNLGCELINSVNGNRSLRKVHTDFAGLVQLVEHLLAKEKVVGSSPIARSKDC